MSDYDRNAVRWGQGGAQARSATVDQGLRAYMLGVYNNMMVGLVLTGLAAFVTNYFAVAHDASQVAGYVGRIGLTSLGVSIYVSPLKYVLMFAPLAFVLFFSFRLNSMSASAARTTFYAFSAVMGVSIAWILLVYTGASISRAFFITAAAFGGLSLYGYTTKRDLSPMAAFLWMGLIGLIVASLVNMFVHSSGLQLALSYLTVLIFSGFTAYDTQSIKALYWQGDSHEVATKKSVLGALRLYLDFLNIFMALLNITGQRKQLIAAQGDTFEAPAPAGAFFVWPQPFARRPLDPPPPLSHKRSDRGAGSHCG